MYFVVCILQVALKFLVQKFNSTFQLATEVFIWLQLIRYEFIQVQAGILSDVIYVWLRGF